jgi:hypothetical protein
MLSPSHLGRCLLLDPEVFATRRETARTRWDRRRERLQRVVCGKTEPAATTPYDDVDARAIRALIGMSQTKFAELPGIKLATLHN